MDDLPHVGYENRFRSSESPQMLSPSQPPAIEGPLGSMYLWSVDHFEDEHPSEGTLLHKQTKCLEVVRHD